MIQFFALPFRLTFWAVYLIGVYAVKGTIMYLWSHPVIMN